MKMRYDKEDDVMMIWLSKAKVDYAEQSKNVIMHFSKDNKPVLMEVLSATEFYRKSSNEFPKEMKKQIFA